MARTKTATTEKNNNVIVFANFVAHGKKILFIVLTTRGTVELTKALNRFCYRYGGKKTEISDFFKNLISYKTKCKYSQKKCYR